MKFDGINESLFDEVYDVLLARYSEDGEDFMQRCPKKRSSGASKPKPAQGRKSSAGQKPRKPTPPKQKKTTPKKPNKCGPKAASSTARKDTAFSETQDFKTCERKDGTTYGIPAKSECVKGAEKKMAEAAKAIFTNPQSIENVKKQLDKYLKAMEEAGDVSPMAKTKRPGKLAAMQLAGALGRYLGNKLGEAIFSEPEYQALVKASQ